MFSCYTTDPNQMRQIASGSYTTDPNQMCQIASDYYETLFKARSFAGDDLVKRDTI